MQKQKYLIGLLCLIGLLLIAYFAWKPQKKSENSGIISYQIDLQKQDFQLYWKDDTAKILKSIQNLKDYVEAKGKTLIFAMNAGMFTADNLPQGLFIQEGKEIKALDIDSARGNFYLKPNGVFYTTTDNQAFICKTEDFKPKNNIRFATQSGPMLVINGQIHPAFTAGSSNLNIRNGVGILPNQQVIFAMSEKEINLYDFAQYFQDLGCKNALYLDGFVSRMYLPEKKWTQTDGNFGVMIGITK